MKRLTKDQIMLLHDRLIDATGGTFGARDEMIIESALNAPFQTFDSVDVYPPVLQKAARLGYGLAMNHGFLDGNKRIGVHAMLVFLALNGIEPEYTQTELSDIFLGVASGADGFEALLKWLLEHTA